MNQTLQQEHASHFVKILDENGNLIGHKRRADVDKTRDILHCADVLVFDGQNHLLLARVPDTTLYAETWSSTTATMVRTDETPEAAARRALKKELGIPTPVTDQSTVSDDPILYHLGDKFFTYDDGVKRLKSTFTCRFAGPLTPNPDDVAQLQAFTLDDLAAQIISSPASFSPTFLGIWETYLPSLKEALLRSRS